MTCSALFQLDALLCSFKRSIKINLSGPHVLHPVPVPCKVWSLVSLDLITGLPESAEGYVNCLTMIDYFSKWPIAKPLRTKTAKEVALALMSVYADWGICDIHITDQGTEFCNKLMDGKH